MTVRQIRFAVGRAVNLGNFNSCRVDYEEVADITPGEDEPTVYAAMRERVYNRLYGEIQAILSAEPKR